MTGSAIDEVIRQHVFIERWLSGDEIDENAWQRFEHSLADRFEMVVPAGNVVGRAELLNDFGGARGAVPEVRIEVREAAILYSTADLAVVRYEEWQHHDSFGNQRVSTAVLVSGSAESLPWSWLALHETELPSPSSSEGSQG